MTPQVMNWVIAGALLFCIMMVTPLALQFFIRLKTKGRMMAAIKAVGKPLQFKLLRVDGELLHDGTHDYIINGKPGNIIPVDYPLNFPKVIDGFRVRIDCSLYKEGQGEPVNWDSPMVKTIDSRELKSILDPYWLRAIVKGTVEETMAAGGVKGGNRWSLMSLAVSGFCLIVLFVVLYKLSGIQSAIALIPHR